MTIPMDLHDVILLDRAVPVDEFDNVVNCTNTDSNNDGFVSFSEAYQNCIAPKYLGAIDRLNANLFSECAPTVKIEDAQREVDSIVSDILPEVVAVSKGFGIFAEEAMLYLTCRVTLQQLSEKFLTLPVAEDKGTGQLGISWKISTGEISVRPYSAGEYAGLETGDVLVRINDVVFDDAYPEDIMHECFGLCGEIAEVVVERDGKELTFLIEKGPN